VFGGHDKTASGIKVLGDDRPVRLKHGKALTPDRGVALNHIRPGMCGGFLENPFPFRLRDVRANRDSDAAIFPIRFDDEVWSVVLDIGNQVDHPAGFVRRLCLSNKTGPKNVTIEDSPLGRREVVTILIVSKKLPTALVIKITGEG